MELWNDLNLGRKEESFGRMLVFNSNRKKSKEVANTFNIIRKKMIY